ncbi:MAG: Rhodanese domain protein [Proteobacteria bacterium]|jgi:hypothetical protein|nr:Rhodanese domain protein [Pseudomonadota bacterium]
MIAPIASHAGLTDTQGFVAALVLGVFFGFFLERAGFANARKLAAVFYFYDMAVLKVMFSAIVTAAVGLWALGAVGVLDLSEIYLVPTHVIPQFVGGLILGVGFVVGGYCPGTSVTGMATGRLDAFAYSAGILGGLAVYGETYPAIEAFTQWTDLGEITFPDLLGIPRGILVALVVIGAGLAFVGASKLEQAFASRRPHDLASA